jgi:uracil-DNA glycosylase
LRQFLNEQKAVGKAILPPEQLWFNAFWQCPFDKLKVVILGQDPYHAPGQAHGLAFSVPSHIGPPPSLKNILKELQFDLGLQVKKHLGGDLTCWARQGVLLLNATLTVEQGLPGSHQKKGWETFTDRVIYQVSAKTKQPLAFVLWGAYAQAKASWIDQSRHLVLKSVHPSPLSAHRGFFGSKPFSKVNDFLRAHGQDPIDWDLNEVSKIN